LIPKLQLLSFLTSPYEFTPLLENIYMKELNLEKIISPIDKDNIIVDDYSMV